MSKFEKLRGTWVHTIPWDTDDYLSEYTISGSESNPVVEAHDSSDGEKFEISDVVWTGEVLKFKSLMPSTKRIGFSEFVPGEGDCINTKFTFTVVETMKRKPK